MKNALVKTLCLTALCTIGLTSVQAAPMPSKAEQQKYMQVCKGKSEGASVSFAHQGVIYNGTCVAHEGNAKKLTFQPPMPPAGMTADTQSRMMIQQSEPRPAMNQSAPMQNMPMNNAPMPMNNAPMRNNMPMQNQPMQNAPMPAPAMDSMGAPQPAAPMQ